MGFQKTGAPIKQEVKFDNEKGKDNGAIADERELDSKQLESDSEDEGGEEEEEE